MFTNYHVFPYCHSSKCYSKEPKRPVYFRYKQQISLLSWGCQDHQARTRKCLAAWLLFNLSSFILRKVFQPPVKNFFIAPMPPPSLLTPLIDGAISNFLLLPEYEWLIYQKQFQIFVVWCLRYGFQISKHDEQCFGCAIILPVLNIHVNDRYCRLFILI